MLWQIRLAAVENKLITGVMPATSTQYQAQDNSDILQRLERVEQAIKNGVTATAEPEVEPGPEPKKTSARLFVPIPEDELNFDYPTAVLARNWGKLIEQMLKKECPYIMPLKNCMVTFDKEGLIILVPEDRGTFTLNSALSHIEEIRRVFRDVSATDYTIKIANRGEVEQKNILNAFTLPKTESKPVEAQPDETVPEPVEAVDVPRDNLDEFCDKFSSIIIDGDKQSFLEGEVLDKGEQSTFDDEEREEFLDESEIDTGDEEEI